jgi:hypothetical protein
MLSVTIKSYMLSVFMLNIVAPNSYDFTQTFSSPHDEEANKLVLVQGTLTGRPNTVDLLIKIACFVKKLKTSFEY